MDRYEVCRDERSTDLFDRKTKYSMQIVHLEPDEKWDFFRLSFQMPDKGSLTQWITGRDLSEYDSKIQDLIAGLNPDLQYVDVGAGVGEFVPFVASKSQRHLPIVIDSVDYHTLRTLLEYAQTLDIPDRMKKKAMEMLQRCNTILNPKKVRLINMGLEKALEKVNDLFGIADVVVDNAGTSHYADDFREIWKLEKKLLKPNGLLLSEVVKNNITYNPE